MKTTFIIKVKLNKSIIYNFEIKLNKSIIYKYWSHIFRDLHFYFLVIFKFSQNSETIKSVFDCFSKIDIKVTNCYLIK